MSALPISVLTGFLGSGKTTLLSRLLRDPALARTAVIVNEFGEVGLDHLLVEASDEEIVLLEGGCLCCKVRGDLVRTAGHLLERRARGAAAFERIVVETTGLADPAPILQALMTDREIGEALRLESVIATVDCARIACCSNRWWIGWLQSSMRTSTNVGSPRKPLLAGKSFAFDSIVSGVWLLNSQVED
jgi:G3E family GTPase